MKVLFVATVRSHIGQFHMPFIRKLKELGCTVDAAFKDNSNVKKGLDLSDIDNVYEISFSRSPYSTDNIKAYRQLKKVIDNGNYDAIHCHTPMGAVVTRLAAKDARKKGTKVIYTAHGFHFYNGASKKNWLIFYNVEKYLAKFTDCLILINNEDYALAKEKQFSAKKILKVNGVGVDLSRFKPASTEDKLRLRREYGFNDDDFILIYPADFCFRKNQEMIFEVMELLIEKHENIKLLLPGLNENPDIYVNKAKEMGIDKNVFFMGYRRDIDKLVAMSDVSVSTSRQEGLPINLVEAMAVGNPLVVTDVRGNNDLAEEGMNGFLVPLNDSRLMADRILQLYDNPQLAEQFGKHSLSKAELYSEEAVVPEMVKIYKDLGLL
ncbi:MAG: glycosyltransferase family 4 protein [Eubacterium sp.]